MPVRIVKCLIVSMSAEKIIREEETFVTSQKTEKSGKNISNTVDINHLLARVRKEERKEYKVNLVFFVMFAALILIAGILLSL